MARSLAGAVLEWGITGKCGVLMPIKEVSAMVRCGLCEAVAPTPGWGALWGLVAAAPGRPGCFLEGVLSLAAEALGSPGAQGVALKQC